jgi:hypothetical protein
MDGELLERKRQLKNKQTTAGWCVALGLLAGATSGCLSEGDVDDWALSGIDGERVDVGLASEDEESDELGTLAAPLRQTGSPTYVGFPAAHLMTAHHHCPGRHPSGGVDPAIVHLPFA